MFKYLMLLTLVACKSTPAPQPQPFPTEKACATVYDPHLCLITIDSTTFAGHGSNKCVALKKLRATLVERGHNPLISQKAECGRVLN
jgi:hypothetical protein